MEQKGGFITFDNLFELREKIAEIKTLKKQILIEYLQKLELDTSGNKDQLEQRLIFYILQATQQELEEESNKIEDLPLSKQKEILTDNFIEITQDTYDTLYTKLNPEQFCNKFKYSYDLRRFGTNIKGDVTKMEKLCLYYYQKQSKYQNKVITTIIDGTKLYQEAQDFFESKDVTKLNKQHIENTINKYQSAVNHFRKFISMTNFSFTNFYTYEFHKILPNHQIINRLLKALGSLNASSRRMMREWVRQKITEIQAIIFTLNKLLGKEYKKTKKTFLFIKPKTEEVEMYKEILSQQAMRYEEMFKNVEVWVKPTNVYDGDTFTCNILFPPMGDTYVDGEIVKQFVTSVKIRCNDYDTPEMKGKTILEKKCAFISKIAFIREIGFIDKNHIDNQLVLLNLNGLDKYGRLLGTVYKVEGDEKKNINQFMIDNHYAYSYQGKTKTADVFLNQYGETILNKLDTLHLSSNELKHYNSIQ